jgi:uncharacterized RDD family membrane protein YckC
MKIFWSLLKTGVLAFFIAGAIVFPLVVPYYMSRVVLSLGLMGVIYGIESVFRLGVITTTGLISDSSSEHSVRIYGFLIWAALFGYSIWRKWQQNNVDK